MKVHAYDKTIEQIFSSTNTRYVVPRFQREYSWNKEEIIELWEDILSNITKKDGVYQNTEYFIGSLVLVGDDESINSTESMDYLIVDGQQRLTSLTIMVSALVENFKIEEEEDIAKGLYSFIEGKDMDNKSIFKFDTETPKPFFQTSIQYYDKRVSSPESPEEKKLKKCYDIIFNELRDIRNNYETKEAFINYAKAIRNQIRSLKTIFITVDTEEDAYTIFETLNARGINLEAVDLIKNTLFKTLNYEHPDDDARTKWDNVKRKLLSRGYKVPLDTFYRHFWLSKYEFSRRKSLYTSFKKNVNLKNSNREINIQRAFEFLNELETESNNYVIVTIPHEDDWRLQEEQNIYKSLLALQLFKSVQINPLLTALYDQYQKNMIKLSDFENILIYFENFHFIYSTISAKRTSTLEKKYSKHAIMIRESTSKHASAQLIETMKTDFNSKLPNYETFLEGFKQKWYTKKRDKDKKIIQYIFTKWEDYLQPTDELDIFRMTLEHIHPQSSNSYKSHVGKIGNLVSLSSKLNENAEIKPFKEKVEIFKNSQLKTVENFISSYGEVEDWNSSTIDERTNQMADFAYNYIWKIDIN